MQTTSEHYRKSEIHPQVGQKRLTLREQLYEDYDQVLQIESSRIQRLKQNYHPVLERARIIEDGPEAPGLRDDLRQNIITALAEYFEVRGGSDYMKYVNGQLRSRIYGKNDDVITVIKRGVHHRASMGSLDQEREQAEIIGFEDLNRRLLVLPVGSKVLSLSPSSKNPDSPYQKQFIDEYISVNEENERRVYHRRTLVNFSIEDFKQFAKTIDAHFFDGYDNQTPLDAWFLSHPLTTSVKIPEANIVGYPPEKFDQIKKACSTKIESLLDALFSTNHNWLKDAIAINNLLDYAVTVKHFIDQPDSSLRLILSQIPHDFIINATTQSGPCGEFGPIKYGTNTLLENTAAKFGIINSENYDEDGTCQSCNKKGPTGKCSHKCYDCEDKEHPDVHFTR